jgi:hypothetical protein
VRIGIWPSPGMMLLINLPGPRRRPIDEPGTRYWTLELTEAGKVAFYAEIERWIDRRRVYLRPASDPQFFYESARTYSAFRNCHDFTLDVLGATGFPLGLRLVNTAGALDRQLARGIELVHAAGIPAIGP